MREGEREERTRLIHSFIHYAINYNNEFAWNSWGLRRVCVPEKSVVTCPTSSCPFTSAASAVAVQKFKMYRAESKVK